MPRERAYQLSYLAVLAAAIALKAVLVGDLGVVIQFSPHDDSLYVKRAFSLLSGQAFGPYDSHTLSKLPGISLWLAATRFFGLPYLQAVNALYVVAGLYLLAGMRGAGAGRALCSAVFVLYLFNPVTMSTAWHRPMREPLGTGLFVLMLAAMLHVLLSSAMSKRVWPHLVTLSAAFAFSLILREEDRLLWAALAVFAVLMARMAPLRVVATVTLVPAVLAFASEYSLRKYVEQHYGLPILNDFSEGEFPRLMAAIRSVHSGKDNRLVMAPQETLQRLRMLVPEFALVVERLPAPGPQTYSCRLQGVCSEWSNGWMPWWIKDAADAAGRTPDLPSAQRYFAGVREQIEFACQRGDLKCTQKGGGLIPPFELRWARGYISEALRLLVMTPNPKLDVLEDARLLYNAPPELEKIYLAVTMAKASASAVPPARSTPANRDKFDDALFAWRKSLSRIAGWVGTVLIVTGAVAFVARWLLYPGAPSGPAYRIATVFFCFAAVRTAALAYVATFLGPFDFRMVFTVYTGALLLSPFVIADLVSTRRGWNTGAR